MSEWIDVNDKMPKKGQDFLVYCASLDIQYCAYFGHYAYSDRMAFYSTEMDAIIKDVTHWQPLPEPPAKEDK